MIVNMEETKFQITEAEIQSYNESFSDDDFKGKIASSAKKAGVAVIYVANLIWLVLKSDTTSVKEKAIIIASLGYFIAPIDLLPDLLPGGFADDFAALVVTLTRISPNLTLEIINTAKKNTRKIFQSMREEEFNKLIESIKVI